MATSTINTEKSRASGIDQSNPLLAHDEGVVNGELSNNHSGDGTVKPWKRRILARAIILLTTFWAAALVFIIGAGYHYVSWVAHVNPAQLIKQGVVLKGPSNVEVVRVTGDWIELKIDGAIGIDADYILGLEEKGGLFASPWKSFGRWWVRRMEQVTVSLGQIELYAPYSRSQHRIPSEPLLTLRASPVTIPLTTRRGDFDASDDSWLTPLSVTIFLSPNKNGSFIGEYAEDAWNVRRLLATARVDWVQVDAGAEGHKWTFVIEGLERVLRCDLPSSNSDGKINVVAADMVDAPLDILPGRNDVFAQFVQEILGKWYAVERARGDAACELWSEDRSDFDYQRDGYGIGRVACRSRALGERLAL